ncbi:GNAT family N-acetyltransferase [Agromyces salentinus]|uniref:N-acetyltransferase domain-containing protein n=1 Tax=Agromyces salentinus TaxID=269421 RepID=A0ABN2MP62_9MICO|nr:GNAT family N-acetyltransferase [Agromyces salentinus]
MAIEIRPVPVPVTLGGPDAAEFEAMAETAALVEESVWGHRRFAYDAYELLPMYHDGYQGRQAFAAWSGDRCVGRIECTWERDAAAETVDLALGVLPEARRVGVGTALLAAGRAVADGLGRTTITAMSDVPAEALDLRGPRLEARDGSGSIPAGDTGAAFALRHGFRLAQLERVSALPVADRAAEFAEASARHEAAATTYRLRSWIDRAPDDLLDELAVAHAAMSTDPPSGTATYDIEVWDAARVRATEQQALDGRRTTLVTAAVSDEGRVAGYTELSLPAGSSAAFQWDTIVLKEHRGHRLGMRMKVANLALLARAAPERTEVVTWNADENEHMLAINIALGFTVRGLSALWQHEADADAGTAGTGATTGS